MNDDTSAKPLPPNKVMVGHGTRKGWGLRGLWGRGRKAKFASASGHKHTRENERRRAQIEKGMLRV